MSDKDFTKLLFPDLLVKRVEITEITLCTADRERIKFLAQTDKPLGDILSVLYLSIPNAKYSEKLGMVTYTHEGHLVTMFSSGKIGMTYVKDRQEAEQLIAEAKDLINRAFVYLKTHGKPDEKMFELKRQASPMRIYEKLPKTNCKECGEQGCFAFATKLFNGEKFLHDCPPLQSIKYAEYNSYIEKMLQPIRLGTVS
jgi:ArsR family metal-binding transcriptional regulator